MSNVGNTASLLHNGVDHDPYRSTTKLSLTRSQPALMSPYEIEDSNVVIGNLTF